MRVNYIKEITSFTKFIRDEEPSGYAQLLWYALMAIFNERGSGDEWPDEIRISTRKLLADFPFSEDTLAKAREELVQLGRLRYQAGNRAERPVYGMVWFDCERASLGAAYPTACGRSPHSQQSWEGKEEDGSGISVDKMELPTASQDSPAVNPQDSPEDNPTVNPKISGQVAGQIQTETHTHTREDDDEGARARLRLITQPVNQENDPHADAIREAWRLYVGPDRLPEAAARDLAQLARDQGMTPEVAGEAIHVAAHRGAAAPASYAVVVLSDWAHQHVRDGTDLAELQVMRDINRGRILCCGTVSDADLKDAKERRRAKWSS